MVRNAKQKVGEEERRILFLKNQAHFIHVRMQSPEELVRVFLLVEV